MPRPAGAVSARPPLHRATAGEDALAEAAADWIVRLSADCPDERQAARAGFEAWKQADPRHAEVAAGMERFVAQAQALGQGAAPTRPAKSAARATLDATLHAGRPATRHAAPTRVQRSRKPAASRARLAGTAVLALALGAAAWWQHDPADLRTATGEQRRETLADGSQLTLASGSAVQVRLEPGLRRVLLLQGEILVDVAKDPQRPLVVDTPQGRIRALGTRFIVRRQGEATELTMLESRSAVQSAAGGAELQAGPGEHLRLSPQGAQRLAEVSPGLVEEAFRHQRLVVQDRPLPEVLDELSRHRPGLIRYTAAELQGLRVTAVLPLDDTNRALGLLGASFPQLRVRTPTAWLVLVDKRPAGG